MENRLPPRFFLRFFRWYCHPKLHNHIEGDLLEIYLRRCATVGKKKADFRFAVDVLLLFRPAIIRPFYNRTRTNPSVMYRNYLKSAWRNFVRSRVFSVINLSGLTLGVTCTLLIALWVRDEYGMDSTLANLDRLYVVTSTEYSGTEVTGSYYTPGPLGETLPEVMPEVEYACSFGEAYWRTLAVGDRKVKLHGNYTNENFFKIFSYPLIEGDANTALKDPESIAISRKVADLLFGSPEYAINQQLLFEDTINFRVTAVFEDLGPNVSQKFEYLINWKRFKRANDWANDWHTNGPNTYVLLRRGADPVALQKKLKFFVKAYDKDYTQFDRLELGLQPYRETYLHSEFRNGVVAGGRIGYVRLFALLALFILLIACFNFMNLSTARSTRRAREIGVRKVIGAMRKALVAQFLIEAGLYTVTAVMVSLLLVYLLLPGFNLLTGKTIQFPFVSGNFWFELGLLIAFTALVSGSYPAFLLSSFRPALIIKGSLRMGAHSGYFRKALVMLQFGLCMTFIVGTIVVDRQVDFVLNSDLGYDKNNLLYLPITGTIATNFEAFRGEVLKLPGVESLCRMSQRPIEMENSVGNIQWEGKDPSTRPNFTMLFTGYDYVKTMKTSLLTGRDFTEEDPHMHHFIINEEALKTIGYKDPIGMPLTIWGTDGTIIGVLKDFHFDNMHVPIRPLIILLKPERASRYIAIRTKPGQTASVITSLENLHKQLNPDFPFLVQFADDEYAAMYRNEQVVRTFSRYLTSFAVFISCLGLLGLIIYSVELRTKEVGVRKILGAEVSQIVLLLAKDFVKLVILATIAVSPLAWYFANKWLNGFVYRASIHLWEFLLAALATVFIALATISLQAIRAARVNPVDSLKSE